VILQHGEDNAHPGVDGLFTEALVLQNLEVFVESIGGRKVTNEPHTLWQMFNEVYKLTVFWRLRFLSFKNASTASLTVVFPAFSVSSHDPWCVDMMAVFQSG